MSLLPGAAPILRGGDPRNRVGVVLCHGFTSTPQSMRPWADHLSDAGFRVQVPLLPGHGTSWQDLATTTWQDWYDEAHHACDVMARHCDTVVVAGLSMGGTLALRLAEQRRDIATVVVVNPSLGTSQRAAVLLPALSRLKRTIAGVGGDIARHGVAEVAYQRIPLRAAASLARLWRVTVEDLGEIRVPVRFFRSWQDHVVDTRSAHLLRDGLRPGLLTERTLENSFHVATLDYDAGVIFDQTTALLQDLQHSRDGRLTRQGGERPWSPDRRVRDRRSPDRRTPGPRQRRGVS